MRRDKRKAGPESWAVRTQDTRYIDRGARTESCTTDASRWEGYRCVLCPNVHRYKAEIQERMELGIDACISPCTLHIYVLLQYISPVHPNSTRAILTLTRLGPSLGSHSRGRGSGRNWRLGSRFKRNVILYIGT
jgi:hypothetical protein